MDSDLVSIHTGSGRGAFDLTSIIEGFIRGRGDGLVSIFVPHATAGVAILEFGSGSDRDLMDVIDELLPRDDRWRHRHGSRGHGADHVLPGLVSPSVTVPVIAGRLGLGTWQSVVLIDPNTDNHDRSVRLSWISG